MAKKPLRVSQIFFVPLQLKSYLKRKSWQDAANNTVAKSLPQRRVILPEPFV